MRRVFLLAIAAVLMALSATPAHAGPGEFVWCVKDQVFGGTAQNIPQCQQIG